LILKGTASVAEFVLDITRGTHDEGDRFRLVNSDDEYVIVSAIRYNEIGVPAIEIEVGGTVPSTDPAELRFTVEAATTGDVTKQEVRLFNFDSGRWVLLDSRDGSEKDLMITVSVDSDTGRFIDADGSVRARVGFADYDVTLAHWTGQFDTAYWTVIQ